MQKTTIRKNKFPKSLIQKVLREKFSLESLRPGQATVIDSVLAGNHTLALMPTGAGKSLCFQLPAMILPGKTIVISPLIALMNDQKEHLDKLHLPTIGLNSTLTEKEQKESQKSITAKDTEFIYVTPERFVNPEFIESIQRLKVDMLVIDEAHCISEWGHDFRPAYLQIKEAWKSLGQPQVLALTATATNDVIQDIMKQLSLPEMKVFSSGVLRNNLFYEAHHAENEKEKLDQLIQMVMNLPGCGIIYCASVRAAKEIHQLLAEKGKEIDIYHGKLSTKERTENRQRFMSSDSRWMVATNAFGMGIDKPDIRTIIHFQFPGSLESYYQESGRAGRDGENSKCVLLYLRQDKKMQSFFLAGKYPHADDLKKLYRFIVQNFRPDTLLSYKDITDAKIISAGKAKVLLALLNEKNIIESHLQKIKKVKTDLTEVELESVLSSYGEKKEADAEKLKQMIVYAQTALCRWKMLLDYFDHTVSWERCEHCDNCKKDASRLAGP